MAKILVVEDDKYLVAAYRARLERDSHDYRVALDGIEALEILHQWIPDIILLDLVMPRRDGFETLHDIRSDDALKGIPVLVTSNLGQKEDRDRAMSLGANGYIIKANVSLDDILAKALEIIGPTPGQA